MFRFTHVYMIPLGMIVVARALERGRALYLSFLYSFLFSWSLMGGFVFLAVTIKV